jgi:hypothetical protein
MQNPDYFRPPVFEPLEENQMVIDLAFETSGFYMREIDIKGFALSNFLKAIEHAFNIDLLLVSSPILSCVSRYTPNGHEMSFLLSFTLSLSI